MGHEILSQQEFLANMKAMTPTEREDFRDWQLYQLSIGQEEIKKNCPVCSSRKQLAFNSTSVASFIGLVILSIYEWFSRRAG